MPSSRSASVLLIGFGTGTGQSPVMRAYYAVYTPEFPS
jgi:hypothetical protein